MSNGRAVRRARAAITLRVLVGTDALPLCSVGMYPVKRQCHTDPACSAICSAPISVLGNNTASVSSCWATGATGHAHSRFISPHLAGSLGKRIQTETRHLPWQSGQISGCILQLVYLMSVHRNFDLALQGGATHSGPTPSGYYHQAGRQVIMYKQGVTPSCLDA